MENNMSEPASEQISIFQKGFLFHFLFWIMYIVSVALEMQETIVKKGLFFFMVPLFFYCLLTALLVYSNTLLLIPFLLERKRKFFYFVALLLIVIAYTLARSRLQIFW